MMSVDYSRGHLALLAAATPYDTCLRTSCRTFIVQRTLGRTDVRWVRRRIRLAMLNWRVIAAACTSSSRKRGSGGLLAAVCTLVDTIQRVERASLDHFMPSILCPVSEVANDHRAQLQQRT